MISDEQRKAILRGENGNTTNGKQELKRPNPPVPTTDRPPTDTPSTGFSAIQDQVNSAISGLKQAELSLAASAFERLNNQFEVDTDRISQAAELLLDPRVKVATAILKAANRINDRKEEALQIPFGGYHFELPQIPGVPDFGQFYSVSQQQERLLSVGSSGAAPNPSEQN